jgi:putative inorganic carbon (HCO3(-)) transporter
MVIWSSAVKGIQDFPFTGMGLNTFRRLMNILYPYSETPFWLDIGHAHNEFLQAGVDLGIPGMIAFISLYIGAFWMLIRTWQTTFLFDKVESASETDLSRQGKSGLFTNCKIVRALIMGFGGGLLAHLLFGLVDAVALGAKPGFMFWLLLGLITGLYTLIQKPAASVNQVNV